MTGFEFEEVERGSLPWLGLPQPARMNAKKIRTLITTPRKRGDGLNRAGESTGEGGTGALGRLPVYSTSSMPNLESMEFSPFQRLTCEFGTCTKSRKLASV